MFKLPDLILHLLLSNLIQVAVPDHVPWGIGASMTRLILCRDGDKESSSAVTCVCLQSSVLLVFVTPRK
jgi:hypothetical protein